MTTPATSFRARRPKGSPPRSETLSTAVTKDELAECHAALESGGFKHPGDGVRKVMFAYMLDPEVQKAVARAVEAHSIA